MTLVERGKVGSGASDVAAGMVAALSENLALGEPLNLALYSRAMLLDILPSLQAESGIDVEYRSPGILHVAVTDDEERELRSRLEWQGPLGMDVRWLTAQEAYRAEPALGEGVRGALSSPNEGHLNSRRLVRAYAQAAAKRGADILQDTEVMGLTLQGSRVTGVKLAAGEMEADWVVMASGAWATRCGEWLGLELPVQPVRGQIVSARILPSPISSIVWRGITYLVPKADGAIVIGTTREWVGFRESATLRGVSGILDGAIELVPAVADAELGHVWAGLRPGSPDDSPMLGPCRRVGRPASGRGPLPQRDTSQCGHGQAHHRLHHEGRRLRHASLRSLSILLVSGPRRPGAGIVLDSARAYNSSSIWQEEPENDVRLHER